MYKKIISLILALSMVSGIMPNVFALEFEGSPNTSFNRKDTPNKWKEIERQTAVILKNPRLFAELDGSDLKGAEVYHDKFSRTYLLEDGTYTTRIYDEPFTFTDGKKEKEIDNTLVSSGKSYKNKANAYEVILPKEGKGVTVKNGGKTLEIIPQFGVLKNGVVQENAIRYNGVADGVDLQYTATGSSVKEDIILNHPVSSCVFSYELKAKGVTFALENNTVYGTVKNQAEPVFVISAPEMTDASGNASAAISLSLEKNVLTVTPDKNWLDAPERAYPVTVDPRYKLTNNNLTSSVVQAFDGEASGPDMEHYISYLYAGFEDGSLVATMQNGVKIRYGESWSYIKINDITPYLADIPDVAILNAYLHAYKYSGASSPARTVEAKMILEDWHGNGKKTWNNRPMGQELWEQDSQDVSGGDKWVTWDITEAFKRWKNDASTNRGIMLTPNSEEQPAVCFSGTGNAHGKQALYVELKWTYPEGIDENLALNTPNVELRPLVKKTGVNGLNFAGVFADGTVRPALQVDYRLNSVDNGTHASADYGRIYPNSNLFTGQADFSLGYFDLFQSNWQSKLFKANQIALNTEYNIYAQGTVVWVDDFFDPDAPGAQGIGSQTPEGKSDTFIIYRFQDADTLPYVANYYGTTRAQMVKDNFTGDDLAMPGNTLFIRPTKNATVPYTRPDDMTLEHMRALIYANMGRSQTSEFDIEPVNMNTGNFWFESVDAQNTEYNGNFQLTRTYNSLGGKSAGVFGRGWSFEYLQTLTARADGGMTLNAGDGKQLVFPQSGGGWASPIGYNWTLAKQNDADPHKVTYKITDENGSVRQFDSYGILRTVTDAKGFITTVNYDGDYRLTGITTGSGRNYGFTLNADSLITAVTLPNGGTLRYEYDMQGYMTAFVNADGDRVTYTYNANGQMEEWRDGRGNRVIHNEYDSQGRVETQIDAAGGVSEITYTDGKTTLKNAENTIKTFEYDSQLRTTKVNDGGNDVNKTWNAQNQQTSKTEKTGKTTGYAYDDNGNVTKETRSDGAFREVRYNAQNKPVYIRDFDGGVTENTYDGAGNLTHAKKLDNSVVKYTYDGYGRVTSITDGEDNTTHFEYDGLTSMTMTDPYNNKTTCYYDAMGRLINEVDPLGIEHKTMYSPNGKKIGTWQGRIGASASEAIVEEYNFDGAGNCVEVIDANGGHSKFTYNAQNQMTRAENPLQAAMEYTYDKLGHKLSEKDSQNRETRYEYNSLGQLEKTIDPLNNFTLNEYDGAGRLKRSIDKRGNATAYEYDDVLNLLVKTISPAGTVTYEYTVDGKLKKVKNPDGTEESYTYDVMGRTKSITNVSGLVTNYTYNANGQVTQTADTAGRVNKTVYDKLGRAVQTIDPMERTSFLNMTRLGGW